jgi:hypothetical protein
MRFALVALFVTACGSSTGPCPVPPPGPLPELPAQPGFTVRRCPPASTQPYQDSEFFAERTGTHPATDAEIAAFYARHASALIADGATAVGIGACCQAGPSALCLAVDAQAETPGASSLLANLDRMVREDGTPELGLPVKIALAPVRLPRCAASDPACGPVSYDHQCAPRDSFDGPRTLVRSPNADPRNVCGSDGDCYQDGCGNGCTSYRQGSLPGTCEYSLALKYAWCGCVQGRCGWFH